MQNVKQKMTWLWQNSENVLIASFFLTFTFNVRKVFLTPFSYINGGFNEYMTPSFSWADVLMLATIIIYTIKLLYSQYLNLNSSVHLNKPLDVSRETFWLLLFLGWIGISIFWSPFKLLSLWRFAFFVITAIFAYICIKIMRNKKRLKIAIFLLVINGSFQSLLAISQFVLNKSIGLQALGESIIGPNIDGVAKIFIEGEKHIRAYGTLPHPNILAGFLTIPLLILLAEAVKRYKKVSYETFLSFFPEPVVYIFLSVVAVGFIVSLSRSAIFGLVASLVIFFVISALRNHAPFGNQWLMTKSFLSKIIVIATITTLGLYFTSFHSSFFSNQSIKERKVYQNVSYETIVSHPFLGVGLGQFVLFEYKRHPNLAGWQYQPVHNTFLLIFSELGIVGLILILLLISRAMFHLWETKGYNYNLTYYMICVLVSFFVISFFDHYFWDIQLGTLIFVIPFILAYSSIRLSANVYRENQQG